MKPVLPFFALLALSPFAAAQIPVNANTAYELPSLAPIDGKADHETIAVNSNGDVLIVWSASVYSLSSAESAVRRVECAFLRRTSATTWDLYPTQTLGEADPLVLPSGTIYPAGDICRKADVVPVGDDFAVAWQRIENDDTSGGRLEAAYIEVPTTGDAVYHLESSEGIGWVLDNFDPRTAGGMVDLACAPGTTAPIAAAYVHHVGKTSLAPMENAVDFDLRAVTFDFPIPGAAPSVNAVNTLEAIPYDDFGPGSPNGGRVLPDIVFDRWGNLVVAAETFARSERTRGAAPNEGKILLRRYSIDSFGVTTLLNAQELAGTDPTFAQRRPNLFRSPSNDAVSLAWGEIQLPSNTTWIFHYDAVYPDAVNNAAFVNQAPAPVPNMIDPNLPVPLQYKGVRGVVIVVNPSSGSFQAGYELNISPKWELLSDFSGKQPWRPSLDVLESDPLRPGRGVVVFGMEGRITAAFSRILIEMMPI